MSTISTCDAENYFLINPILKDALSTLNHAIDMLLCIKTARGPPITDIVSLGMGLYVYHFDYASFLVHFQKRSIERLRTT